MCCSLEMDHFRSCLDTEDSGQTRKNETLEGVNGFSPRSRDNMRLDFLHSPEPSKAPSLPTTAHRLPSAIMIVTVLGPVDASHVSGCCLSREELLHKAPPATVKALHDNPITLANLAEVRSSGDRGHLTASNRLFSLDESVQELASLKGEAGLILECSTAGDGQDPSGLAEISSRSGLSVVMAASVKETDCTKEQASAQTIGKDLEHQLLFGGQGDRYASPTAASGGASSRFQAGFLLIKLDDDNTGRPGGQEMTTTTTVALEGAVKAQQATAAPLMLACPHLVRWSRVEAALEAATAHWGASPDDAAANNTVIVAGMHGGVSQSLRDQAALLQKGAVLCFDCFGRVEWLPGPEYYPSDEESAVRIAELVRQGFADRIVLSSGVSRRIHLSRFGGHGYGHALRTVPPRLRRLGVSAEDIALMTRGNMLRMLDWYTPPAPLEIPKDYLLCTWCNKRFEPVEGEYFHKFQFVYCGIKCLRGHREIGFDADAAASHAA